MKLNLRFAALEPDPTRWRPIRAALAKPCPNAIAVSDGAAMCRLLNHYQVSLVLIGAAGTREEHRAIADRLKPVATRVLVVADRRSPGRVAEYLRLGPHVRLVEPDPAKILAAVVRVLDPDELMFHAAIEHYRKNHLSAAANRATARRSDSTG